MLYEHPLSNSSGTELAYNRYFNNIKRISYDHLFTLISQNNVKSTDRVVIRSIKKHCFFVYFICFINIFNLG